MRQIKLYNRISSDILLSAPPPDPNRTGSYITNRSKRILAKVFSVIMYY